MQRMKRLPDWALYALFAFYVALGCTTAFLVAALTALWMRSHL